MSDQREPHASPDGTDHARAGADPMHPHPQGDDESPAPTDDDSADDLDQDSPGAAAAREHLDDGGDVPEPNEPG